MTSEYPQLTGKVKPTCPDCGGPMERMAWGGTDPTTGKGSIVESWRCADAFEKYRAEQDRLLAELGDRFAEHLRWAHYERVSS